MMWFNNCTRAVARTTKRKVLPMQDLCDYYSIKAYIFANVIFRFLFAFMKCLYDSIKQLARIEKYKKNTESKPF